MDFKTSVKLLFFTCVFAGGWLYCTAAGGLPPVDEPTKALWNAVQRNDPEGTRAALKSGANLATRDVFGYTPLILAAGVGHLEVMDVLMSAGSDVEAVDYYGHRPLHMAAASGVDEAVRRLVKAGADINAVSREGKTPLQYAISKRKNSTAELLRSLGARQ